MNSAIDIAMIFFSFQCNHITKPKKKEKKKENRWANDNFLHYSMIVMCMITEIVRALTSYSHKYVI